MNLLNKVVAVAALSLLPIAASAATIGAGLYDVTDDGRGVDTQSFEGGERTVTPIVTRSGLSLAWTIGSTGSFDYDGSVGTMSGTISNVADATVQFDFTIVLTENDDAGTAATEFDFTNGLLLGAAGTQLDGLSYQLTAGDQPTVSGDALNGFALDMSLGFALLDDIRLETNGIKAKESGDAFIDFNMFVSSNALAQIIPNDEQIFSEVPLPASAWLMVLALGGLAVARRRS